MSVKIGIIDYGMGNLRNVQNAFSYLGFSSEILTHRSEMKTVDKIVLPGVGAFGDAIKTLRHKEWDKEILHAISEKKPFLGICLGMQLLFDQSFENGCFEGLHVFSGDIVRFDLPSGEKIPHMGWNSLDIKKDCSLFGSLPPNPYVYFVHSYHAKTNDDIVTATCCYGKDIPVAVAFENVFGLQFHPEKSGDTGLTMIKNFGEM